MPEWDRGRLWESDGTPNGWMLKLEDAGRRYLLSAVAKLHSPPWHWRVLDYSSGSGVALAEGFMVTQKDAMQAAEDWLRNHLGKPDAPLGTSKAAPPEEGPPTP